MKKKVIGYSLPIGMSPKAITDKIHELRYATGASWVDVNTVGRRVDLMLYFGEMESNIPYELPENLADYRLPIPIGYDMDDKLIMLDMGGDAHPYILVGGNPGTGKSVFIKGAVNCLTQFPPEYVRLVLIDMKYGVELGQWREHPNKWLFADDPLEGSRLKQTFGMLKIEIKNRMNLFKEKGEEVGRKILKMEEYNQVADKPLHYIMLVIDEYAELKNTEKGNDYEGTLKSNLQTGRAAGIRCIAATQRPTVDCVSGTVKAVFNDRLAFAVASKLNSRVILDADGAEEIPSDIPGRAIFLTGSTYKTIQVMNYQ